MDTRGIKLTNLALILLLTPYETTWSSVVKFPASRPATTEFKSPICQCQPKSNCDLKNIVAPDENGLRFKCDRQQVCCKLTKEEEKDLDKNILSIFLPAKNLCVPRSECMKAASPAHSTDCTSPKVLCNESNVIKPESPDINLPPPSPRKCGIKKPEALILPKMGNNDNTAVTLGEIQWMAIIQRKTVSGDGTILYEFACVGSILTKHIILTAASCVRFEVGVSISRNYLSGVMATRGRGIPDCTPESFQLMHDKQGVYGSENLKVRIGDFDLSNTNIFYPPEERNVHCLCVHPKFQPKIRHYDLALLYVDTPFNFEENPNVFPICMDTFNVHSEKYDLNNCLVAGWGTASYKGKIKNYYSNKLKKADVSVLPSFDCETQLKVAFSNESYVLDDSFICTEPRPGLDVCRGDVGGPLACPSKENPEQYYQIGVFSWSHGGCQKKTPCIYASIGAGSVWLHNTMQNLESSGTCDTENDY